MSPASARPRPVRPLPTTLAVASLVLPALLAGGCRDGRTPPAPAGAPVALRPDASDAGDEPTDAPERDRSGSAGEAATPAPVAPEPTPASQDSAGHLTRIPEGPGFQVVAHLEREAFASPAALPAVWRLAFESPDGTGASVPACLEDLLGSVRAATYVWQESQGPDAGLALFDAPVERSVVFSCLRTLAPPVPAEAGTTDEGSLPLTSQVSVAVLDDGLWAVGATDLVRAARAGVPPRPLSRSPALARARALAGAAPAWVVWFEPEPSSPGAPGAYGGLVLRTEPRLGLTGAVSFPDPARAGALVGRATELLARLDRAAQPVLEEASRVLPEDDLAPLRTVLEAARDTRFVVDGGTLAFEAWLPPGFTASDLLGGLAVLAPILDLL